MRDWRVRMGRIDEMIQRLCPDGVEYKKLGEVAEIGTGSSNTQDQAENGDYPFYVRSSEVKRSDTYEFDETAIITAGDGEVGKVFHFAEGKYALHQRAYRVHVTSSELMPRFCYWYMAGRFRGYVEMKACSATVMSLRKPMFLEFPIPVPPLDIQHEVVRVLDSFAELEAELEAELKAELEARKAQYAHYRDELLSRESLEAMAGAAVEVVALGSIASIRTGKKPTQIDAVGVSEYPYVNAGTTLSGSTGGFNTEGDTVTMPSRGQGGIGFVGYQRDRFWCGPLCYRICSTDEDVSNRYLFFVLQSMSNDIVALMNEGGTPAVNAKDLKQLDVPVPPLSVQRQVVDIFDRFESLATSLTDCLPAEIEARREQYEYYRDKLLDFPRKEVA